MESEVPFYSYEELKVGAQKVIERVGADHVYPELQGGNCVYVIEDQPACIVGHMLDVFDLLHPEEGEPFWSDLPISDVCLNWKVYHTDPQGRRFLSALQREQDTGQPWGISYETAVRCADAYDPLFD